MFEDWQAKLGSLPEALKTVMRTAPLCWMEQDRIPGFWVVTAWPAEDVILRLRIAYDMSDDPSRVCCEIRVRGEREFRVLSEFEIPLWDILLEDNDYQRHLDEFPTIWRAEFRDMARRWAVCTWILECGSVREVRYAEEPRSSRDCLEFPSE